MDKHNRASDENAPSFLPRTPLAKRLWELRQEVLASSVPLLSLDESQQELQDRRGVVLESFLEFIEDKPPSFYVRVRRNKDKEAPR